VRFHPALRFHSTHAALALLLFAIELSIALFVDDAFVRPYLGDVLVIPLVYCFVATFIEVRPIRLVLGVLGFAFAVELAQYFEFVHRLGLEDNSIARAVLGTSYSTLDLVAYAVGATLTVACHLRLRQARAQPIGEDRGRSQRQRADS